jgi:AraC-like DNA-binding protein
VPLKEPILSGYAGAVQVYRTAEQGPFSTEELRKLEKAAREVDQIVERAREARHGGESERKVTLTPRPATRLFAFNARGEQLLTPSEFARLDSHLRQGLADQAKAGFNRLNGELVNSDRVQLTDSRGDLWVFRRVVYSRYPAMGADPIVLFAMQPSCAEWASVRPADLQADAELARLIPALKFMRDEYHRGPTLGEIARQVHLSPFHFHRRFAELLGLTPKHYLLECQINAAKIELISGKKELAQIAADCGFAHQSHFTSRFKQATGLTPTRWRRQAQDALRA